MSTEPESASVVVSLDGTVVQVAAFADRVVTIGRLPENVIALPNQGVSRRHAEIRTDGGSVLLTDVGSAGGTFVDGVRIPREQPVALHPGSSVHVGPYEISCTGLRPAPDGLADVSPQRATVAPSIAPIAAPAAAPASAGVRAALRPELAAFLDDVTPAVQARATWPAPRAPGAPSAYLTHLPALFHDHGFLGQMLLIFESIWEPLEHRQDHFDLYFDPRTCPVRMLDMLAAWLDLELDPHWPEARRRRLVGEAMDLYRWRGTSYGIGRLLEVCTGLTPTITEDPAQPHTFRISLAVPRGSTVTREFIEELVRTHKPAHVGYVLEIVA